MSARVVCGIGVPHVPTFPQLVALGNHDLGERYRRGRAILNRLDPTLLIVIATDHINSYFLDRWPTLAIVLGETVIGSLDDVPGVPVSEWRVDQAAAATLAEALIAEGFDLMHSREPRVDHSVVVPLHFLGGDTSPLIVLNVNAHVSPLPSARRCHDLGVAITRSVGRLADHHRVAVIASGSFSIESGGPRVDEGRTWSLPRLDWAARVAHGLAEENIDRLVEEATPAMLASAGTAAGEVLGWLAMAASAGPRGARLSAAIDYRAGESFAFGAWRESST